MTAFATSSLADCLQKTCTAAAKHVYEQEMALHDARQTGVTEWITRAEHRLRDAVSEYEAAGTARRTYLARPIAS